MIEQIGQFEPPRKLAIDTLVNLHECQRTCTDLEQVVIRFHALARQQLIDDRLDAILDLAARPFTR